MNLTPRHKLIAALGLLLLLPIVAAFQGASAATAARLVLALASVGGIAFWFIRARGGVASKFKSAPRLNVIQRVGLAQRTGLTLVEIDGKPFVIVHGDGYARIRPTHKPAAVRAVQSLKVAS